MLTVILLRQIAIMAILIGLGLWLCRKNMLTPQGTKELGSILLKVIIPCVIIKAYITPNTPEKLHGLLLSFLFSFVTYLIAMVISYFVFGTKRALDNFGAAFCNAGFIGIPLVQGVIGEEGVFYIAASIAFLNLFQWTYGVFMLTRSPEAISLKTIAKNPVVLSILIGILLFLTGLPVPAIIVSVLGNMANMNTPIAMLLLGSYMAKLSPKRIADPKALFCVLFRLVIIPLVTLAAFRLIPGDRMVKMAIFLTAITPIGTNICVFAQQFDTDYEYSVIIVCLSTILSVVSVPVIYMLADRML